MDKYECIACGYIYDPEIGDPTADIAPGTAFEDLPDDWVCPIAALVKISSKKSKITFHSKILKKAQMRLFLFLLKIHDLFK
jgi:rubredoxin